MKRIVDIDGDEMTAKPDCYMCIHYCLKSWIVTTKVLNVSGKPSKLRKWSKHKCALKQEDKYPKHCDFELNQKKQDELDKRYPDLAAAMKKLVASGERVQQLIKENKEQEKL